MDFKYIFLSTVLVCASSSLASLMPEEETSVPQYRHFITKRTIALSFFIGTSVFVASVHRTKFKQGIISLLAQVKNNDWASVLHD